MQIVVSGSVMCQCHTALQVIASHFDCAVDVT